MFKTSFAALAFAAALSSSALAHEYKVGDLIIDHPVVRATAPGAKVSGGYLVIINTGETDDRLISGTSEFAMKTEIHEITMKDDVMKMQAVPGGLLIPAGATVTLKPGSFHIMFMGLKEPMTKGNRHKATLNFKNAGSVEVTFQVKSIAQTMKMKH